ncbi:MAG: DNA internalization-related competence protein ComEC/Rec2 [Sinimarinibacterium sp.]
MDAVPDRVVSAPRAAADLRWLVLAFSAGVLSVLALPALPAPAVCAALAVTVLMPWRGRVLWAGAVLGVLLATWQGQRYLDQRWPAARHGETLWVEGIVASLPERQPGAEAGIADWRFRFETARSDLPRAIRVSWYRTEVRPEAGQCWQLQLRLRTPHGSLNPGGFDYEGWLLREGIGALASVWDARRCEAAGAAPVQRLRQSVVDRVRPVLGETRAAALIAALTVGDTSGLSDADWDLFRVTGTSHLVAISGFNLGIVAGLAFFMLRWTWTLWPSLCLRVPAQRIGLFGSGVVAVGYALLAGFEPPVTRALIMLLVLIAAATLNRLQEPSRALAYAWGLILLLDPFAVLSPGLWLSFGAVAAILYVSQGRLRRTSAWRLALRVQLFLSVALVPLTLYFFDGLAWLSLPINLIAVPVFSVLTPWLLISVLTAAMHPLFGEWCLRASASLLDGVMSGLQLAAGGAPWAWIPASPAAPVLMLGAIGAVLAFLPRGVPLRGLAIPCLAVLLVPRSDGGPALELTALDVGQGTAVVVRTPRHALLFDAGPAYDGGFDSGRSIVAPFLLQANLRRVDTLLLSHADNDHAGGVGAIRKLLRLDREIGTDAGQPCVPGQAWAWDDIRFEILHPDDGGWSDNNRSCVLKIHGPFSVLLTGDIEHAAEQRLLRDRRSALRADVLLTPHHGSGTSSTAEFIEAVQPAIAIHSAGWRSRYGHPRADVVGRYAALGAAQYTTGVSGAVRVVAGADGRPQVDTWRVRAARWWNAAVEP